MQYLSSKEVAVKWGISPTRVVVLAKQGKLLGAKLVGKSWLIPDTLAKPLDNRYKKTKDLNNNAYIFPLFIYRKITDDFIDSLNDEQKEYLEAEILFNKCKPNEAKPIFEKVLENTKNLYIKIGCLYYLCFSCIILKEFKKFRKYYLSIKDIFSTDFPKKDILVFIMNDLASVCKGSLYFTNDFDFRCDFDAELDCLPYLLTHEIYRELIKRLTKAEDPNLIPFEILIKQLDATNNNFSSEYMHLYLGILYKLRGDKEAEDYHFKKALDISLKTGFYVPIINVYNYVSNSFNNLLLDYPAELKENIILANKEYVEGINELAKLRANGKKLPTLNLLDFRYLGYALAGLSNKWVAIHMHVSEASISKRYSTLLEKLGVENKEELRKAFESNYANPFLVGL